MNPFKAIAHFLYEAGTLARTPRSGFHFLGSGSQSVAEHLHRTAVIAFSLAHMHGGVDVGKTVQMALFHDFTEARISDLNYVHQQYTTRLEEKALQDLTQNLPFGRALQELDREYHTRESSESLLAKDADNLEWILSLKEELDIGNERARKWIEIAQKRLKTPEGQALAAQILQTDSIEWWFGDPDSSWWVNREKGGAKREK